MSATVGHCKLLKLSKNKARIWPPHDTELINFHDVCRDQLATGEQQLKAGDYHRRDDIYANELWTYRRDIILRCLFFLFRFAVWEVSNALAARLTCYWPKETEKLYTPEGSAKYLKRVFLKAALWAGEENGTVRSQGGKCRISTPRDVWRCRKWLTSVIYYIKKMAHLVSNCLQR